MANPADQAAVEAAKFNAEMARTDAGNTMTQLATQTSMFQQGAEQTLAKGMVSLAMSGNTGFKDNAAPIMPGAVGSTGDDGLAALEKQRNDIQNMIYNSPLSPNRSNMEDQVKQLNEKIGVMGKAVAPTIKDPSMLLRASGSDLLTMMNTREMMQRDMNTFIRTQKNSALIMLKNAGHYDKAAEYAEQTANYNTMNTILGYGFKIAGLAIPGL